MHIKTVCFALKNSLYFFEFKCIYSTLCKITNNMQLNNMQLSVEFYLAALCSTLDKVLGNKYFSRRFTHINFNERPFFAAGVNSWH